MTATIIMAIGWFAAFCLGLFCHIERHERKMCQKAGTDEAFRAEERIAVLRETVAVLRRTKASLQITVYKLTADRDEMDAAIRSAIASHSQNGEDES